MNTKAPLSYETANNQTVSIVSDMTAGSSEKSYVQSANGGMVARFGSAVTIEADQEYKMQMILNTEAALVGCSSNTSVGNMTDGSNGIQVPMLPVTAA